MRNGVRSTMPVTNRHTSLKRKSKTRRINFERILLAVIVFAAGIIVVVNVHILTTTTTTTDTAITSSSKSEEKRHDKDDIDEHLLRILRHVGIYNASSLSKSDLKNLPSWEETIARVGNSGPIILGLKEGQCEEYNLKIKDSRKRRFAVAGPFSSGTHLLYELLNTNCVFASNPKRKDLVEWQVPWGKVS